MYRSCYVTRKQDYGIISFSGFPVCPKKRNKSHYLLFSFVSVVNVKEEPGTVAVSSTSVGGVGVPTGMMGSTTPTGVSTTGFAPMEFQSRSKCFM